MKVLYLPIGSQPATERGFRSLGIDLAVFDFTAHPDPNSKLLELAKSFKPDLIHMQLQMTDKVRPDTLKLIRNVLPNVKMTNWTGDIRADASMPFVEISKVVDVSLLSNVGQIELYKKRGCRNPAYWQIGFDDEVMKPLNKTTFEWDAVFLGTNYSHFPDSRLRLDIVNRLRATFGARFGLFGGGYPFHTPSVEMHKCNDVYNNSLCAISISNFNNVAHYFSDRLLMCVASGRPTISYRFPGIEQYFVHNSEILVANNPTEVVELVNKCKANPEWASAIGAAGYRRAMREHTYASRIRELFSILGMEIC